MHPVRRGHEHAGRRQHRVPALPSWLLLAHQRHGMHCRPCWLFRQRPWLHQLCTLVSATARACRQTARPPNCFTCAEAPKAPAGSGPALSQRATRPLPAAPWARSATRSAATSVTCAALASSATRRGRARAGCVLPLPAPAFTSEPATGLPLAAACRFVVSTPPCLTRLPHAAAHVVRCADVPRWQLLWRQSFRLHKVLHGLLRARRQRVLQPLVSAWLAGTPTGRWSGAPGCLPRQCPAIALLTTPLRSHPPAALPAASPAPLHLPWARNRARGAAWATSAPRQP